MPPLEKYRADILDEQGSIERTDQFVYLAADVDLLLAEMQETLVRLAGALAGRPADLKEWAQRHCSPMREVDLDPLDGNAT